MFISKLTVKLGVDPRAMMRGLVINTVLVLALLVAFPAQEAVAQDQQGVTVNQTTGEVVATDNRVMQVIRMIFGRKHRHRHIIREALRKSAQPYITDGGAHSDTGVNLGCSSGLVNGC